MSRRILHITESLGRTGVATQVFVLSRGLVERGCDVHVAALGGSGALAAAFRAAGISTAELGRRWTADPVAYYKLHRLVRSLRPDIVHTWNYDAGVYGLATARWCGVQNVVTGLYRIDRWTGGERLIIARRLTMGAARLTTDSTYLRDWYAGQGLSGDRFTIIPPGVAPAPASDVSREGLLRELHLPTDARLIGVVGRLVPENRVKDLIWAADLLRVLYDNLRLLIIGDGPQRRQLEQYARLASDLDHIQFLGERGDVWRIMPHLDVLWNASENRSHSIAILEAMAAGVPVIASDTPLNRELVIDNETGYLIPPLERSGRATRARRTDRIFNDVDLARQLGSAARNRIVDCFDAEQCVERHSELCWEFSSNLRSGAK
ncbi:MAG: glycosyltransferase [Planctomycetes bacterium]|nr:glycosyltransferase [Planctomycetota bacterium]